MAVKANVKDFGAKGDGSSDDTAAIERAAASIKSQGAVYFPAGAPGARVPARSPACPNGRTEGRSEPASERAAVKGPALDVPSPVISGLHHTQART